MITLRALADWFVNRFRASNNFQLGVFWAFGLLHLLFNLVVFGFGPAFEFGRSAEEQRYYNAFLSGRFATDAELVPWILRPFGWLADIFGELWGWLRWASWSLWVLLLILNVIYIPIAFRDEVSRAWRSALRSVRERRGSPASSSASPTPPVGAPTGGPTPTGFLGPSIMGSLVFLREVIGATVANILTHPPRR